MAVLFSIGFVMLVLQCNGQMIPVPSFFNVPASLSGPGGVVQFAGNSLPAICRSLLMMGGKEALSDGMGAAAKYLSTQRVAGNVAGGNDPQMQCLYQQATGSAMPGMVGPQDPGNMFGDYFDTVIEYPMILDPCANPQCNGKVNPTVLLMQAYAPMLRMGAMGGMGGMGGMTGMPGMGGTTGGMGGNAGNPYMNQNPLMTMFNTMYNRPPTPPVSKPPPPIDTTTGTKPTTGGVPPGFSQMMQMFQNPQMMQMFKQMMGGAGGMPGAGPMMPF